MIPNVSEVSRMHAKCKIFCYFIGSSAFGFLFFLFVISLKYSQVNYSSWSVGSIIETYAGVLFTLGGQACALTQERWVSFPYNSIIFYMPLYVRSFFKLAEGMSLASDAEFRL